MVGPHFLFRGGSPEETGLRNCLHQASVHVLQLLALLCPIANLMMRMMMVSSALCIAQLLPESQIPCKQIPLRPVENHLYWGKQRQNSALRIQPCTSLELQLSHLFYQELNTAVTQTRDAAGRIRP